MTRKVKLVSTISSQEFPFESIEEFADNNESLEIRIEGIENAKINNGKFLWERYADFLPFSKINESISLGEGNTALVQADKKLLDLIKISIPEKIDLDTWQIWTKKVLEKTDIKPKDLFITIRMLLTGKKFGPSMNELLTLFTKKEILERIETNSEK